MISDDSVLHRVFSVSFPLVKIPKGIQSGQGFNLCLPDLFNEIDSKKSFWND